jgi:hypothetical protein
MIGERYSASHCRAPHEDLSRERDRLRRENEQLREQVAEQEKKIGEQEKQIDEKEKQDVQHNLWVNGLWKRHFVEKSKSVTFPLRLEICKGGRFPLLPQPRRRRVNSTI